jgi:hypothetical protein
MLGPSRNPERPIRGMQPGPVGCATTGPLTDAYFGLLSVKSMSAVWYLTTVMTSPVVR